VRRPTLQRCRRPRRKDSTCAARADPAAPQSPPYHAQRVRTPLPDPAFNPPRCWRTAAVSGESDFGGAGGGGGGVGEHIHAAPRTTRRVTFFFVSRVQVYDKSQFTARPARRGLLARFFRGSGSAAVQHDPAQDQHVREPSLSVSGSCVAGGGGSWGFRPSARCRDFAGGERSLPHRGCGREMHPQDSRAGRHAEVLSSDRSGQTDCD
jgi:hypothetical protein